MLAASLRRSCPWCWNCSCPWCWNHRHPGQNWVRAIALLFLGSPYSGINNTFKIQVITSADDTTLPKLLSVTVFKLIQRMNYYESMSLSVSSIFKNLHINHTEFTAVCTICFPFSFLRDSNSDSGKCRKLQAKTDEMVKADTTKLITDTKQPSECIWTSQIAYI